MTEADVPRAVRALWGADDGPRRGPKPAMSVPVIAEAAVAIADESGIDAVSMASVAKRLGHSAMSLYRYVDTKDDLLHVMVDVAYGPVTLAAPDSGSGGDWRAAATAWAVALLDRCLSHPWLVNVKLSTPPLTPNSVGWMDAGIRALSGTGMDPQQVASSLLVLDNYVRGHVRLRQEYSEEALRSWSARLRSVIDAEAAPAVWAAVQANVFDDFDDEPAGQGGPAEEPWPADDFAFGLEIQLGGIERLSARP